LATTPEDETVEIGQRELRLLSELGRRISPQLGEDSPLFLLLALGKNSTLLPILKDYQKTKIGGRIWCELYDVEAETIRHVKVVKLADRDIITMSRWRDRDIIKGTVWVIHYPEWLRTIYVTGNHSEKDSKILQTWTGEGVSEIARVNEEEALLREYQEFKRAPGMSDPQDS
jgi:hypothetical protein